MNEETPVAEAEQPKCRALKQGRIDLHCTKPRGHQSWHGATYTDHQEVDYDGAHHAIHLTETVTWEPVDSFAEAARLITAASRERAS